MFRQTDKGTEIFVLSKNIVKTTIIIISEDGTPEEFSLNELLNTFEFQPGPRGD